MPTAHNDWSSASALPAHPAAANGLPDGTPAGAALAATPHAFSEAEQRGVYRAIHGRRDMRHFSGGSVAPEVLRRLHRTGGGMSLDTTLRLGAVDITEWVLVEMRADMVVGGFGTGSVLMWSTNETLVAVAEQTAVLRPAD